MISKYYYFALIPLSLLFGCRVFSPPEFRMPATLDIKVLKWENNKPYIRTTAICYNQNKIGFKHIGGEIDIYVDTLFLGRAIIDTTFYVPKHTEFTVPAYLSLDLEKLAQQGLKFKEVTLRLEGNMKGSALGVRKTVKVNYKGKHDLNVIMKPFGTEKRGPVRQRKGVSQ